MHVASNDNFVGNSLLLCKGTFSQELAFRASALMLSDTFSLVYNELSEEEIF